MSLDQIKQNMSKLYVFTGHLNYYGSMVKIGLMLGEKFCMTWKPPSGRKVSDEQILQKFTFIVSCSHNFGLPCVFIYHAGLPMNALQHLNQAISDFELVHQRKPTRLILTWDVRAELERQQALPDFEIVNATVAWPVLRVE